MMLANKDLDRIATLKAKLNTCMYSCIDMLSEPYILLDFLFSYACTSDLHSLIIC